MISKRPEHLRLGHGLPLTYDKIINDSGKR